MTRCDSPLTLIQRRRTHKRFDGQAVPTVQLRELVEALRWAPNHRLTQPWRAYVLDQSAVRDLASWICSEQTALLAESPKPEKDQAKIAKLAEHYFPTLGAVIQVTQLRSPHPDQDREDYGAVCAGVQNMLLCAEAQGLAHFWSTSALMANPVLLRHLGIEPSHEQLVASLWLGGRSHEPPVPARHAPETYCTWIGSPSP